jgi:hypothetical protein
VVLGLARPQWLSRPCAKPASAACVPNISHRCRDRLLSKASSGSTGNGITGSSDSSRSSGTNGSSSSAASPTDSGGNGNAGGGSGSSRGPGQPSGDDGNGDGRQAGFQLPLSNRRLSIAVLGLALISAVLLFAALRQSVLLRSMDATVQNVCASLVSKAVGGNIPLHIPASHTLKEVASDVGHISNLHCIGVSSCPALSVACCA